MPQVAEQAVGNVDCTARHAAQCEAQGDSGLRPLHRPPHPGEAVAGQDLGAAEALQCKARLAQGAADIQRVTRARARAKQGLAVPHLAEHRDADVERALGRVATDQFAIVLGGQREQTTRKAGEERFVGAWQGERQTKGKRLRATGRQVTEIDG